MLLAIETSTRIGSVALFDGGRVVAHRVLDDRSKHGSALAPAIEGIAELDLAKVDAYALSIGPGSFTGLRIGLAFVKGLAVVHPRPAIAVSTLEILARQIFDAHPDAALALPLVDARRSEVYAGLYRRAFDPDQIAIDPGLPEAAYPIAAVAVGAREVGKGASIIAAGDGVLLDHGSDPPWTVADRAIWTPDACTLGRIAERRFQLGDCVDVLSLEPAYLQLSPAESQA